MSGRDWRSRLLYAVPWVVFLVALSALVVCWVAWAMGGPTG